MEATGEIHLQVHYNELGNREHIDYTWKGGDVAAISLQLIEGAYGTQVVKDFDGLPEIGDRLRIGAFDLRVVEFEPWNMWILAARDRGLATSLRVFWHKFGKVADIAYRRLIITLAVWGLARRDGATVPHWRDVYALDKIAKALTND
jgi:hypothetical protein